MLCGYTKNMLKSFYILLISILLISCNDSNVPDSPASDHINQYTKELEDCKDHADHQSQEQKDKIIPKKEIHARGFQIEPDDIVFGSRDSKVTLVEYFAPTCPACAFYHKKVFPEIKRKYIDTNKIAYVMRELIGDKRDLDAAILARCKGDIDNYTKFMDVILERQDNWAFNKNYRQELVNIGMVGGISQEAYTICLNSQDLVKTMMENTKFIVKEPKFIGTPSFFINGDHFSNPYTFEEISSALEKKLQETKGS